MTRRRSTVDCALRAIAVDCAAGWHARGISAELLAGVGDHSATAALLRQFHEQAGKDELWETALAIERSCDSRAVPPLIHALNDANPDRRRAAARALGWVHAAQRRASKALARALADRSQPQPVREEAAESLAYVRSRTAVPALIAASAEPDVRIRFWSCFALGSYLRDPRVVAALEARLSDEEIAPGGWWAVKREALAMLADDLLAAEIRRVDSDSSASAEDRRWAGAYRGALRSRAPRNPR
jgi:HEAT repeat protein